MEGPRRTATEAKDQNRRVRCGIRVQENNDERYRADCFPRDSEEEVRVCEEQSDELRRHVHWISALIADTSI